MVGDDRIEPSVLVRPETPWATFLYHSVNLVRRIGNTGGEQTTTVTTGVHDIHGVGKVRGQQEKLVRMAIREGWGVCEDVGITSFVDLLHAARAMAVPLTVEEQSRATFDMQFEFTFSSTFGCGLQHINCR